MFDQSIYDSLVNHITMWTTKLGRKVPGFASKYAREKGSANIRILEKLPLGDNTKSLTDIHFAKKAFVLDTETTGLEKEDKIIQLSILECFYSEISGEFLGIGRRFNRLHDPGVAIKSDATDVNGLTYNDIKGRYIHYSDVQKFLGNDPLIIAHNAKFDQVMLERTFPKLPRYRWACSLFDLDWKNYGFKSLSLENICLHEGWYFNAHNAMNDCYALAWILSQMGKSFTYLELISQEESGILRTNPPFGLNHYMKGIGFQWNPKGRYWWKRILMKNAEFTISELTEVYDNAIYSKVENIGKGNYISKEDVKS